MDTRFKKGMIPWNKQKEQLFVSCLICHINFSVQKYCLETRKYCSRKCAHVGQGKTRMGNKYRLGTKQSEATRKLMSEQRKGEKNVNWIKDRSLIKLGDRKLHDPLTKQWRMDVKQRDNFTCRIADNNCDGKLEVHHILRWSEFPELRYKTNNGITLCHAHHPRARAEEKRLIPTFTELVSMPVSK